MRSNPAKTPDLVGLNMKVSPAEKAMVEQLAAELGQSIKSTLLAGATLLREVKRATDKGEQIHRVTKRGRKVSQITVLGVHPS